MEDLVSIIVPVYNTEEFLPGCLNSIVDQTYRNIEVILVDDGSTDSSGAICDDYSSKDSRFKVFHLAENKGASFARNIGLRHSSGEWICFADADDSLYPEMIETLRNAVSQTSALVAYCEFSDSEFEEGVSSSGQTMDIALRSAESCVDDLCSPLGSEDSRKVFLQGILWNKIYHRSLLDGMSFDEELHSFVDQPFSLGALLRCDTVAFVDRPLYKYTVRRGTLSHPVQEDFSGRYLNSCLKMLNILPKNEKRSRSLMLSKIYQQMYTERLNVRRKEVDGIHRDFCSEIIKETAGEYFINSRVPIMEKIKFVSVWFFPGLYVNVRTWFGRMAGTI